MTQSDVLPTAPRAERPAVEHLAALGAQGEWERRAEWLETEAKAQRDPAARSRLLLAASEVRAISGARADARRLAIQAANHQPAPPLAARQARALHLTHGDVSAVARGLVDEVRSAESPQVKAHAHYLAAEIQRVLQRDLGAARASIEAALAADPKDGRSALQRLLLELAENQQPPESSFPENDGLARAVEAIRALRGGPMPAQALDHGAAIALVEVQRAVAQGDLERASEALAPLAERPGLLPAVRWLRALWSAARADGTAAALAAHRELVQLAPGYAARRALAARAVAAGDAAALREALAERESAPSEPPASSRRPTGDGKSSPPPVFSRVERVALAALVGERTDRGALLEPHEAHAVGSIIAAVGRASIAPPDPGTPVPRSTEESEFALGRAMAEPGSATRRATQPSTLEGPGTASALPWGMVLRLEQSRRRGDWASVAHDLTLLLEAPTAIAESAFVAAVFAEKAGDAGAARALFQASLPSPSTREAATRALTEKASDGPAPLRALSAHTTDPLRRALLLTEALFRLEPGALEFDALAEDATRSYPDLPLAVELGESGARARGDRTRALRWFARRRENAVGADDQALAGLREALFVLDVDPENAGERLLEVMARRPDDLALFLASERAIGLPLRDRAEFRKRLAPSLGPRGRFRFLAEAVGLFEASGERAAAFALARELGGPLGELWAARLASTDAELDGVANEWLRAAQRTADPALGADLYDRLAQHERRRGRLSLALAWQRERLALEPQCIEALRALDIDNMAPGREAELEQTSSALFEALGERDAEAHAYVATRLAIARGAFDQARSLVHRLHASAQAPLWALRLDAVYARDAHDDRTLLAACRSLRERSSQALDAAILSLHAAEAALRLEEPGLARDDIQRASELAPDDIVILSARAEVLRENGDHAEAAEAYETLASATSSKPRQVDALYQAALLWLDRLGNRARGMLALSEAASLDVPHRGLLERLVALHAPSDDLDGLGELIERQRHSAAQPAADTAIDLSRALDAAESGRIGEARNLLSALLERRPRDVALLHASATVHVRAGEWLLAETEWRQVIELEGDEAIRHEARQGLAALYEKELPKPEPLPGLYSQILARDPGDVDVRQRFVALLASSEAWSEAAAHQRELLARATDEAERKARLLYLIELLDRTPESSVEAESLLEQARHTWSADPGVLEAEVLHYTALDHTGTARVILERAMNTARATLAAGRIEPAPLELLARAAHLAKDGETARAAEVMASAVASGTRLERIGAGGRAGETALDDLTAPALLSGELRHLLLVAGAAIERAYGLDPRSLDLVAPPDAITATVRELARGFGLDPVKVWASPDLGEDCRCFGPAPVSVVVGAALIEREDPAVLTFVVLRALTIAKINACALSQIEPDEVGAILAGFFACFGPPWPATGQDAQRLLVARNRLRPHVTWVPEPDLSERVTALMSEVLPRVSELREVLSRWGTRVALLGVGDPSVALDALMALDPRGLAAGGEESRMRWIATHPEARDLVSYGVSDAYIDARQRAGLVASAR